MKRTEENWDVVVVGGGLAGLSAAALLAQGGARTLLLERAPAVGGRAGTKEERGFLLNQGPHALYAGGEARALCRRLGVDVRGRKPPAEGRALARGGVFALPAGARSLLATGLLTAREKVALARVMASLPAADPGPWRGRTVASWVAGLTPRRAVRDVLLTLVRVTSYAHAPEIQDAGAAIAQLKRGVRSGVLYLDGGWQTIADGLARAAAGAGAVVRHAAARRVERVPAGFSVSTDAGGVTAGQVLLALPPRDAAKLLRAGGLATAGLWADEVPVRAACLDVGLSHLPRRHHRFALGIDRPHYFSVHSATARLAPEGMTLIHAARYLGTDPPSDPHAVEAELEGILDVLQPGWREAVEVRRFLPAMVVTHGLHRAGAARPSVAVPGEPGLWVAGDWVGDEGMLADASAASAQRAAASILAARPVAPAYGERRAPAVAG